MKSVLRCTQCQSEIPDGAKFCPHCGAPVDVSSSQPEETRKEVVCPSCGIVNAASNLRCTGCGSELAGAEQAPVPRSNEHKKKSDQKKKKKERNNFTAITVGAFIIVVAAAIIFETRNAPMSDVQSNSIAGTTDERVSVTVLDEIARLEKEVESDPTNSDAVLQLANRLHDAKFFPRAIEAYKKYITLNPREPDPRVDLGICYYETGDYTTAVKEVKSALAIDPKHQMAMFNLGVIELSSNNVEEARKWFKKCSEVDPTTVAGKRAQELLKNH